MERIGVGGATAAITRHLAERLKKFLLNIDDLETKAWLWKWLKKEKRI